MHAWVDIKVTKHQDTTENVDMVSQEAKMAEQKRKADILKGERYDGRALVIRRSFNVTWSG